MAKGPRQPFNGEVIRSRPKNDKGSKPKNVAKVNVVRDAIPSVRVWLERAFPELEKKFGVSATIQGTLLIKK